MKTSQALDMIAAQQYDKEFDGNVWSVLISNLNTINHILDNDEKWKEELASFARKMLRPAFEKLGWSKLPDEKHTNTLLRSAVIRNLGEYGDASMVLESQICFGSSGANLDADLKSVIYSLVAQNGGQTEFDALLKIYDETNDAREKERIQSAISCFKSEEMIKKAREFIAE